MLGGEPVTIFGDGTRTRDYVYVGDVVEATIRAAAGPSGVVANVGWGREVSDRELFRAVAGGPGYGEKPTHAPGPRGGKPRGPPPPPRARAGPGRGGGRAAPGPRAPGGGGHRA